MYKIYQAMKMHFYIYSIHVDSFYLSIFYDAQLQSDNKLVKIHTDACFKTKDNEIVIPMVN